MSSVKPTGLTHLDTRKRPTMVDVSDKSVTHRIAVAEARMRLPASVAEALRSTGHRTKKGPVFDTAIVSGIMAAKRTHELIPFCHPLPLDNCAIEIESVPNTITKRSRRVPGPALRRPKSSSGAKCPCITGREWKWRP